MLNCSLSLLVLLKATFHSLIILICCILSETGIPLLKILSDMNRAGPRLPDISTSMPNAAPVPVDVPASALLILQCFPFSAISFLISPFLPSPSFPSQGVGEAEEENRKIEMDTPTTLLVLMASVALIDGPALDIKNSET